MEITIDTDNYFIQEIPPGKKAELSMAVAMANGYMDTIVETVTLTEKQLEDVAQARIDEINIDVTLSLINLERETSETPGTPDTIVFTIDKTTTVPNPKTPIEFANTIISNAIGSVVRASIKKLQIESVRAQKQAELDDAENQLDAALDAQFGDLKVL